MLSMFMMISDMFYTVTAPDIVVVVDDVAAASLTPAPISLCLRLFSYLFTCVRSDCYCWLRCFSLSLCIFGIRYVCYFIDVCADNRGQRATTVYMCICVCV